MRHTDTIFLILFLNLNVLCDEQLADSEEVFEDNDVFGDKLIKTSKKDIVGHVASSTEDLSRLFCSEQTVLRRLSRLISYLKQTQRQLDKRLVQSLVKMGRYRMLDSPTIPRCLDHVSNPLNSYHLLSRTVKFWPETLGNINKLLGSAAAAGYEKSDVGRQLVRDLRDAVRQLSLPDLADLRYGGMIGLMNLVKVRDADRNITETVMPLVRILVAGF